MGKFKIAVCIILIILVSAIAYHFPRYDAYRGCLPWGASLAGIPAGGMEPEEAKHALEERFRAPFKLNYLDAGLTLSPEDIGFQVEADEMLAEALEAREWIGFWRDFLAFLLHRPVATFEVPLRATYDEGKIKHLLSDMASKHDQSLREPRAVEETLSFVPGQPGRCLDVEASLPLVIEALTSAEEREVDLVVEVIEPSSPSIDLLNGLLEKRLEEFPGIVGVFVKDLEGGEEMSINGDVAFSGMSTLKVAIVEEVFHRLDEPPDAEAAELLTETMTLSGKNYVANQLLSLIGDGDARQGARELTKSLNYLGLVNTFMGTPYDDKGPPPKIVTPANSRTDINTNPDPYIQTTPKEVGLLLEMLYWCAKGGGTFIAAYPNQLEPCECQEMLSLMEANREGTLIEEGLPEGTRIAHKHGWIDDTHADAAIVFSPGGDYVISVFVYRPEWLDLEESTPLIADISKAAYSYFNRGF
ncbi:MAG: serine hydrolase [Chloroflexota bacterium]|nr:serine hydrolase [Chloroflexota bacterium]